MMIGEVKCGGGQHVIGADLGVDQYCQCRGVKFTVAPASTGSGPFASDAAPDPRATAELLAKYAEPTPPRHRHELKLTVGAHTLDELRQALEEVAEELHDSGTRGIVASPSGSRSIDHAVLTDQTREKYVAQLDSYLLAIKRCCELDTDGDGNCPVHSSPGVRR